MCRVVCLLTTFISSYWANETSIWSSAITDIFHYISVENKQFDLRTNMTPYQSMKLDIVFLVTMAIMYASPVFVRVVKTLLNSAEEPGPI